MCGIIGIYLSNITSLQIQKLMKLLLESGIRGVHGTGISYLKNGKITTFSSHSSSKEFFADKQLENYIDSDGGLYIIAHTRYSTSDLKYNQPIGDSSLAISHNGVISQEPPNTWKNQFGFITKTTNDSELIYACLKKNGEPLSKFRGSMAVCILENKKLTAFRNHERPLWYSQQKNGIIFASTKNILFRSGFSVSKKCQMYVKYCYTGKLSIQKLQSPPGIIDLQ